MRRSVGWSGAETLVRPYGGKSMRPRASLYRTLILIAVVPTLLAAASLLLAQPAPQESPALTLEKLAREKFSEPKLTPTELRVVQAAASGEVAWGGEEIDQPEAKTDAATDAAYHKQSNDPAKATEYDWRHRRSIRADLIRWLCEDEEARKLVDQHGIHVVGAWIDGVVDLSFLHINFPIILWQSRIPNGIKATSAEMSDLELVGSWIGEDNTGAHGQDQIALKGEGLMVHGNVLLSDGFRAFGQVDLYGAKIDGQLYCTDGRFSHPSGDSLRLRLASIGGETELNGGFSSDGVVDLVSAKINGDLLLDGAHFSGPYNGLKARSLTAHALRWTNVSTSDQTELDLLNASVVIFEDDERSWPAQGHLTIDGFVYGTHGMAADAASRLEWLNLQPFPHRPQPYKQLAKVFVDNGQDSDATDVLVAKEADMREQAEVPDTVWQKHLIDIENLLLAVIRKVVRGTLRLTIDYGYQPLRALWWIAAFVALGTYTFRRGYRMGLVIPTDHEAYKTFKECHNPPAGYQPFNSFVYSLENFVPLIELHQAGYWLPYSEDSQQQNNKRSGTMLRWYLWLHILLGWIFTSILVAGLAGLIRNG
jgi:hypothetical protein